jgi:N-acetylglucosamine kinase-like BadF-type ATPase
VHYYLGIDGGGTKTTGAVGDDTRVLARVRTGPSNIIRVGEEQARESLHECVRQACAAAGIAPAQIERTCVGGSGAGRPELAKRVQDILAEVVSTPIIVVGDMEIALNAAFDTGPGVIVIAGTGSIAYGRNAVGEAARAGGWGFAIGDEGSAHWIGRAAVNAVLRAADEKGVLAAGDYGNSLAEALSKVWRVESLIELARRANANPPPDFAALFPAVASSSDELARQVLLHAGSELARIAALVIQRLFTADGQTVVRVDRVRVAMTGSVFGHSEVVRETFYNELRRLDARADLISQIVEPVEGALRMAKKAAKLR